MTALTGTELAQIYNAADEALATGRPVVCLGYALAPDTLLEEAAANGLPVPTTWMLRRADGRTVSVYRAPAGVVTS